MPKDKNPKKPTTKPPKGDASPASSSATSPLEGPVVAKPKSGKSQTEIPGTERAVIPEVEAAIADYKTTRDTIAKLRAKLKQGKATLISLYKKHGIAHHPWDDEGEAYDGEFGTTEWFKLNKLDEDE